MMKKLTLIMLVVATTLWSCSDSDNKKEESGDYVSVTIGTESGDASPRTIVGPTGGTNWNINDKVVLVDVDGSLQNFNYASTTPKSSSEFKGELLANQGNQLYRAYHVGKKSEVTFNNNILTIKRGDEIEIHDDGQNENSEAFGEYCSMVAIPLKFEAKNADHAKNFQFYHLNCMIETRVTIDKDYVDYDAIVSKKIDEVIFTVEATDGSKPFYNQVNFDLEKLNTSSTADHLKDAVSYTGNESSRIDKMYTTMRMNGDGPRDLGGLLEEYKTIGAFPIPIFALPTNQGFKYKATVCFMLDGEVQVQFENKGGIPVQAERLNPAGLNVLNFDQDYLKL